MATSYNMAKVRELLTQALSATEFEALCYDHFRAAYDDTLSLAARRQKLLAYCETHVEMESLLAQVQKINPTRYAEFAPHLRNPDPPPASDARLSPAQLAAYLDRRQHLAATKSPLILATLIFVVGGIVAAYIIYRSAIDPLREVINATKTVETKLTALMSTAESLQSTIVVLSTLSANSSTSTPGLSGETATPDLRVLSQQSTGTAVAKQATAIASTQTALAPATGVVPADFPAPGIWVHSDPTLPDDNSNVVGGVQPGDRVTVTGWTYAPWIWYRIDVPSRHLGGVWISGRISLGGTVYDSVNLDSGGQPPPSLYIEPSHVASTRAPNSTR